MPITDARARARKWWLKSTDIEFVYNTNKSRARLIIKADKADRVIKQEILISCLPQTTKCARIATLLKKYRLYNKPQKTTTKASYISDDNMVRFAQSSSTYEYLGGLNQDFGEDQRRAGF